MCVCEGGESSRIIGRDDDGEQCGGQTLDPSRISGVQGEVKIFAVVLFRETCFPKTEANLRTLYAFACHQRVPPRISDWAGDNGRPSTSAVSIAVHASLRVLVM